MLASGQGSNFQAVVDASARGELPLEITSLVTNRPNAYALTRATEAGIATHVEPWRRDVESRDSYDARLVRVVAETEPDIVLLLGWMHVLPATFIARFPQLLNVHPAFLPLDPAADVVTMPDGTTIPAFRGAHAFDDALAAGSTWTGASVHRVNVAVDRGVVIARAPLRIDDGGGRPELEARLHALEHRVPSAALARWCWEQR
ncbi:MAG: phosphoribosylglycinamide formyltransferase [Candidatus Eremiobacteraeota bacterium]|nr:phosphoribosylglycinamide formyltransferase [Candidatus Eremiobacteraeota bacterium]